jgi:hypothetical protein
MQANFDGAWHANGPGETSIEERILDALRPTFGLISG